MNELQSNHYTQCARGQAHTRETLNVLIACEESQAEVTAFRELGHNAFSCDVQPCLRAGHPEWHIHGDCLPYLYGCHEFYTQDGTYNSVPRWDLIICHPPCTYLCKVSSVQLKHNTPDGMVINGDRFNHMKAGATFFYLCLNAQAPFVAVENPLPMKMAGLPKPSFYTCPSWFGVKYTKKTLWWVRNLPAIMAECDYPNPKSFVYASRGKYRSRTFPAMAKAIAKQWSEYITNLI